MTRDELIEKATSLSGLPTRKNKYGYGALRWLSIQLDVNIATINRWIRLNSVPRWVDGRIELMEKFPWSRKQSDPSDAALQDREQNKKVAYASIS